MQEAATANAPADLPPKFDGRHARSARTRECLVLATRELMRRGAMRPTANMIAAAADLSPRSLFQHFADLRALYREALADEDVAHAVLAPLRKIASPVDLARAIVCGGAD